MSNVNCYRCGCELVRKRKPKNPICSECKKEYHKEYRENNKDKIKEYQKEYCKNHKKEKREYDKEYYSKPEVKERRREYYKEYGKK